MPVWVQFGEKRVTTVPPLSATDDPTAAQKADVFAYFNFSGEALPEGAKVTFLIGKGKLPGEDDDQQSDETKIHKFTVDELRTALVPLQGVSFAGGEFEAEVKVARQLARDSDDKVVFANVAKVTLDPVTDLLDDAFTIIAYTTFDKLNKQERVQACSADISIASGGEGTYLSVLEVYDPVLDSWTTKTSSDNGRSGPVFEEVGGDLYLSGGFNGNFTGITEKYVIASDSWTQKATMPFARGFSQSVVYNNEIYVFGGFDFGPDGATTTCHKYTPLTDSWTQLANIPVAMAFGIVEVFTVSGSDYAYVTMGGSLFDGDKVSKVNRVMLRYGLATDVWEPVDVTYGTLLTSNGITQVSTTLQDNAAAGVFSLELPAGLNLPPFGALTLDRGGAGQLTILYTQYTKNTGLTLLSSALPSAYLSGTTVSDATIPLIESRLGANSYTSFGTLSAVNGQSFSSFTGSGGALRGTTVQFDPSTGVFDRTSTALPSIPRMKAGFASTGGFAYFIGGSAEKSDFLDENESFDGAAWADQAEMLFARNSLGVAESGGLIYAAGGSGSGHAPGWLKIEATANPEQVRADGKQTASIVVTAVDASGDPPPPGTEFRVSGIIFVEKPAAATDPDAVAAPAVVSLNPPAQKVSILPVLFTSNLITMGASGTASTIVLERSEDPITEVENLTKLVRDGEAVPNQEALKKQVSEDLSDKITMVGERRDLYSAAIEITAVDPFYFGATDTDKAIAGDSSRDLSSNGFSFNPPKAEAGLSATVTFYSDIASIPDVAVVGSELDDVEAKDELDNISEEIPFGASPHYDALLTGVRERIDPDVPRKNLMITASDNEESFSQSSPDDVIDEANSIDGQEEFPIFVTNFIVTDPVSLSARKSRTDVQDLERISDDTGGSSFSVVDPSYVSFVIDRIKTAAPSSIGSGTITATHELNGPINSVLFTVDNLPADMNPPVTTGPAGNVAEFRLFTSEDNYTYTEFDAVFLPNETFTMSEPLRTGFVRYEVRLVSKTFDSPVLQSVTIGYVRPNVQFLFTRPQAISGQISELAAVANHRLRLPTSFDYNGMTVEIGLYHGESFEFDRDYKNAAQPPIRERGVIHAINRSFDTFIGPNGEISTADTLVSDDFVVYTSKSGPWSQEATIRAFVNGQEALTTSYIAFPERGLLVFQRKLGANDTVTIEVTQPSTVRVALKVTNDTLYEGLLDSFAFMFGTTEADPGLRANRPPRALNLFISPSPIVPGGPIEANYTFSDPDGDEEDRDKTEIVWFRDGAPVTELRNKRRITNNDLVARRGDASKFIEKGQEWFFTVRPSDGKAFGQLSVSHTVTISNTTPVAINSLLTSSNKDSGIFTTSDTLTASFKFADTDGDTQSGTRYDWFVNGNLEKSGDSNTLGPDDKDNAQGKLLKPGVTVRCEITPSDGTSFGETATTSTITVSASSPTMANVLVAPAKPFPTNKLKITYKFTSPDGERDASTIAWYKNGERITDLDESTEVPASMLAPRQQWYSVVTPVAAGIIGTAVKSNVVVVQF